MQIMDYLLTGLIIGGAVWYLYRVFVVKKGCSCGSSSCSTEPATKTVAKPATIDKERG